MQYVNGHEISSQCISEILSINEKAKIPKAYEQDGISVYETVLDSLYIGKCQTTLKLPPEFAFTQVRHSDYEFLPGCVEHHFIERYNFDNLVLRTRLRSPALEGRLVEYCSFVSCYSNPVKKLYAIGFRGIKHEKAQFTQGALVIDLLPSGYIFDVPPGTPDGHSRCTMIFQIERRSLIIDGSVFSVDQVVEVAKREYQHIYFHTMRHLEQTFHKVHPHPYISLASDTHHSLLDVMSSLGPSHGWTCQIQKYGFAVYTKKDMADTVVCCRVTWAFCKPPSVVKEAFTVKNVICGYPNVNASEVTEKRISDDVTILEVPHHSLFEKDKIHKTTLLVNNFSIGDRHSNTYISIEERGMPPQSLASGIFIIPIEGGTRVTCCLQWAYGSDYFQWPEKETAKIVACQLVSPFKAIRDRLLKGSLELPQQPNPHHDSFGEIIKSYSKMFLDSFDIVNETTALGKRFDGSGEKRKRGEEQMASLTAISSREMTNTPPGKDDLFPNKDSMKPFLFLMSNGDTNKKYKRVITATSDSLFDSLPADMITRVGVYLDVESVLALSISCRFFWFYVHDSAKMWKDLYHIKWESPQAGPSITDWREAYMQKITEEKVWRSGSVIAHEWQGHTSRLKSVLWDKSGLVASCSYDKSVKIWDPEKNTEVWSLEIPGVVSLQTAAIPSSSSSSSSSLSRSINSPPCMSMLRFLAPKKNGLAEWWEWKNNTATKGRETRFGYSLKGLVVLHNRTITWDDEIVKVWDNSTGNPISVFSDHTGKVNNVITLDDEYFVVASADNTISVRSINKGGDPIIISGHNKSVNCLQSLSSTCFASGSSDSSIKLWDLRNVKACYQSLTAHTNAVRCLYSHENVLASGGDDMKLNLYVERKGLYLPVRSMIHTAKIHHITGYKNQILVGDNNGLLKKLTFEDVYA